MILYSHDLKKEPDEIKNVCTKGLFQPEGPCGQVVEEIIAADIVELVNKTLKVDSEKIIDNHKKRLIPRFRLVYHFNHKIQKSDAHVRCLFNERC